MILVEGNKKLVLTVVGYQYPIIDKNTCYDDANWLNVSITYTHDEQSNPRTRIDACVETWDISHLATTLKQILNGKQTKYVSDFLEPYLEISITRVEDKFQFDCSFCYEIDKNDNWKTWEVSSLLDSNQVLAILNELQSTCDTYPIRPHNLFAK